MKRYYLGLIIIVLFVFTAACSVSADFVIINETDTSIDVAYELRDSKSDNKSRLRVIESNKLNERGSSWHEIEPIDYFYDEGKGLVKIKVAPGKAILIETMDPFYINERPYENGFDIKSLEITGKYGSVKYDGDLLIKQFRPVSETLFGPPVLFEITYKNEFTK